MSGVGFKEPEVEGVSSTEMTVKMVTAIKIISLISLSCCFTYVVILVMITRYEIMWRTQGEEDRTTGKSDTLIIY